MNLYEITDIKTGKTIEPAVTLKQAAERLKCSGSEYQELIMEIMQLVIDMQ